MIDRTSQVGSKRGIISKSRMALVIEDFGRINRTVMYVCVGDREMSI